MGRSANGQRLVGRRLLLYVIMHFKESMQGHSRGKVSILGGDTVVHCQKNVV